MRGFLIISFLSIVFSACTKSGKNISVMGIIKNPVTNEPYSDIQVKLLKTDGGLPSGLETVKSVYSNSDGYFEIHHLGGLSSYYIQIEKTGNHHFGWRLEDRYSIEPYRLSIERGNWYSIDHHMVPKGQLILNIDNVNCQGPDDEMQFRSKHQYDSDWGSWSTIREGCYSYTSPNPFYKPTGYTFYETKVTRSGVTTYVYDTVFINESGVAQVDIFY